MGRINFMGLGTEGGRRQEKKQKKTKRTENDSQKKTGERDLGWTETARTKWGRIIYGEDWKPWEVRSEFSLSVILADNTPDDAKKTRDGRGGRVENDGDQLWTFQGRDKVVEGKRDGFVFEGRWMEVFGGENEETVRRGQCFSSIMGFHNGELGKQFFLDQNDGINAIISQNEQSSNKKTNSSYKTQYLSLWIAGNYRLPRVLSDNCHPLLKQKGYSHKNTLGMNE